MPRSRRWEAQSFEASFGLLSGLLSGIVVILFAAGLSAAWLLSGLRAYVACEGLWSKSQKNAVQALYRYAASGEERHWLFYQRSIAVPLADRMAREELARPQPDLERVRNGFLGGRNDPEDIEKLTALFRHHHRFPHMSRAIEIWADGDREIDRLRLLADSLRGEVQAGGAGRRRTAITERLSEINARLSVLQDDFSYTLGEGARRVEGVLLVAAALSVLLLLLTGLTLTRSVVARMRQSHERYSHLLATARDAIFVVDADSGRILEANHSAADLVGRPTSTLVGREIASLHPPGEKETITGAILGSLPPGGTEGLLISVTEGIVPVEIQVAVTEISEHRLAQFSYRDIRARKATELLLRERDDQLRQAQKMESLGRLAGGIAHDFNNLLTVILGQSSLMIARFKSRQESPEAAELIQSTAKRGADLTRQLLAFGRRQVLQPALLDVNRVIADVGPMLRRLIGEGIVLQVETSPALGRVRADRTQLEQVIINLVVNARDAMPDGGKLHIETDEIELGRDELRREPPPGRWVRLIVRDSGMGMDAATRARIFEPFFTTKSQGRGTGLGLATVDGIVRQSGGYVQVESTVGTGTLFRVHLPWSDATGSASHDDAERPAA